MFWAFAGLDSRELGQLQNRKTEKGKRQKAGCVTPVFILTKRSYKLK